MSTSEIFGSNVFNDAVMQEKLPKATYKELKQCIANNKSIPLDLAQVVANAMKDWAIEKGCTHYTHWFQPMTLFLPPSSVAEKHAIAFTLPASIYCFA